MSGGRRLQLLVGAILIGFAGAGPSPADGPAPRMVGDFGHDWIGDISRPYATVTEMNGVAYFVASDGIHGNELWRSDLTVAGTAMVSDICPGDCSSASSALPVVWEDTLYFWAKDGSGGYAVWRSDGTDSGTAKVFEPDPGGRSRSCRSEIAALDGFLLLGAGDPEHGCELWRSDGTPGGSFRLKETVPGGNTATEGPAGLRAIGPSLALFAAGGDLWVTDGTEPGTVPIVSPLEVQTLSSGNWDSQSPWVWDGLYYFWGDDGTGLEPWVSDGTPVGTRPLGDFGSGDDAAGGGPFLKLGDGVFFSVGGSFAELSLVRTDGTPEGTEVVLGPSAELPSPRPTLLGTTNSSLYFSVQLAEGERVLWRTDGTPEGSEQVASQELGWIPQEATAGLGDRLIFPNFDEDHGREFWVTDGTEEGTELLADTYAGPDFGQGLSYFFSNPSEVNGSLLFFGLEDDPHGFNPWVSDGTPAGTTSLLPIDSQTSTFFQILDTRLPTLGALGRTAFFLRVSAELGLDLIAVEGDGEFVVLDLGGQDPNSYLLPRIGDRIVFQTRSPDSGPGGLWATDGTNPGTELLLEVGIDRVPWVLGGLFVMSAVEGVVLTDGTPAGSRILPVLTGTSVAAQAGGPLFLGGRTDGLGSELWILNDVAGTPELVLDISPGPASSSPGPMAARPSLLGPRAIFFADRADTGRELWTSDGTPEGTELVLDIRPGAEGSDPPTGPQNPHLERKMVFLGSTAFFSADDGVHGAEPWVSDGTPGGTGRLLDLAPGPAASLPQGFTVAGGRVFFTATTPAHGRELWQSDGTGPGTTRVTDLNPGPASSIPMWFTEWNGTLFFSAYDPTVGTELRALDLETGGVTLVHDINPGIGSSSPGGLVQEGGLLWFGATDGVHGFEPWVYELGGVFVDGFESGDLEAWSDSTP